MDTAALVSPPCGDAYWVWFADQRSPPQGVQSKEITSQMTVISLWLQLCFLAVALS